MIRKSLLFTFLTFFTYMSLFSQESELILQKLVDKNVLTQTEAEEIKQESQKDKTNASIEKIRNIFNTPYLQIGGNGQFLYSYSNTNDVHNDFKAKNLFISVNGTLNEYFRYGFLFEFIGMSVQEFWGEWTATDYFNFKVGQFKVPITIEGLLVPATLETVSYSRSMQNLFGFGGDNDAMRLQNGKTNNGRDAGVQVSGEALNLGGHHLFQYSLGMFQGMGVNSSDKNNGKDFAGTLMLQPVKGFRIGGGLYFGQATYALGAEAPVADHVRNRYVVSADYKSEGFNGRVEWLNANDGGIDREGINGLVGYYFMPNRLFGLLKVDYYNRNKDIPAEAYDYTVGLNYYFYNQCRLQVNYTYSDFHAHWDVKNSHAIMAQLQIGF